VTLEGFAEKDPKSWTHAQLEYWFRHVDRDVASDQEWAAKARACVHSHSELLWERIKGALGVPPELDVSEEEMEEDDVGGLDASVTDFVLSPVDITQKTPFNSAGHGPSSFADVFDDDFDSPPLSIEPVFATDPNASPSVDPQVGLGDISEAAEEEAENADAGEDTSSPPPKQEEVIHGLRISTSVSSPASHIHGSIPSALASPIPVTGSGGNGAINPSSEGSHRLRRSSSTSSSIRIDGRLSPYFAYRSARDDDSHAGIERGSPLFPGSFANLATSPTLRPT